MMNSLCGVRLSTVGMVVGWLYLVGSLLSSVLLCMAFTNLNETVQAFMDIMSKKPSIDEDSIRLFILVTLCVSLTTSLVNVIASALLIIGTVKERHLLLTPWLLNTYINIIVNVVSYIYMIYLWIENILPYDSFTRTSLTTNASLLIQIVIWRAIYSLFKQIRANPRNGGYPNYTKMSDVVQ